MKNIAALLVACTVLGSCQNKATDYEKILNNPLLYSQTVHRLTDVITYDIITPPVAARIYAYAHLAAYEVIAAHDPNYQSLEGQVKGLIHVPPAPRQKINVPLAALLAFMDVGQELTFSRDSTQQIITGLRQLATGHGMPLQELQATQAYARTVSKTVLAWAQRDNYAQTRSAVKYTVNNEEGRWVPTPPAYMQAVEPAWMEIRPIVLDSAGMFLPPPPVPFSRDTTGTFYQWVKEVYEAGQHLTEEQKAIADFWDCNGFKLQVQGHMMFATKAMTPGGHWMGITGAICQNQKADFNKTVYTYTSVAFGIFDGFITCWNTKFHWSLLRPETYINNYIDLEWKPYLQTPPFPEYTSGHSVISSAAATLLTHIYGEQVPFTDSTERAWGWPDRHFRNPREAALEASLSRLYGGIHYRASLEQGLIEGEKVGNYIFEKLRMRKK